MNLERAGFVVAVLIAATVLVVLDKLSGADWKVIALALGGMLIHAHATADESVATPS